MKKPILIGYILALFLPLNGHEKKITAYPFPNEFLSGENCPNDSFPVKKTFPLKVENKSLHNRIISQSKNLEQRLKQKIYGQDEAVKETVSAILRFAAGVNDPSTPIASFLYCGPSGVGKTELAKQLCLELYGYSNHFIRINMSEYIEAHSISRLTGSPPGYVGYESGGTLSNGLLQMPYSVVLLDEIEKAHPKILKLFMHIFDAGYFTSASGQNIDCSKAIFILTSNIASSEITSLHLSGSSNKEILELLKPELIEVLSPEMYNRLDCIVFAPLSDSIFEQLIRKILQELKMRVGKAKEIEILFDATLIDYLKTYRLDPHLGARPLKRLVDKELATLLAQAIMNNACKQGDFVLCSYSEGHVILEIILSCENRSNIIP